MNYLLNIFFYSIVIASISWNKVGNEVYDLKGKEEFGQTIFLVDNGNILAVYSGKNNSIYFYQKSEGEWVYETSINNIDACSYCKTPFYITESGNRMVVRNNKSLYAFEKIKGEWERMGDSFHWETDIVLDYAIAMSDNGLVVAVSNPKSGNGNGTYKDAQYGEVLVYKFNGFNWVQKGQAIYGKSFGETLGTSIALNYDGNLIAIGGSSNQFINGNDSKSVVRTYMFGSDYKWEQLGDELNGPQGFGFGESIDINLNGTVLVVGSMEPIIGKKGSVSIYELKNNSWWLSKRFVENNNFIGGSVTINQLGNIVGFIYNKDEVHIYEHKNSWEQIGKVSGVNMTEYSYGHTVDLSKLGDFIAISSPFNNKYAYKSGLVQVYKKP